MIKLSGAPRDHLSDDMAIDVSNSFDNSMTL